MSDHYNSVVKIPKKDASSPIRLPYQTIHPVCNPVDNEQEPPKKEQVCGAYGEHYEPEKKPLLPPPTYPNPVYPANATLPLLTPIAVAQTGNTLIVTASIPAEAIISLPCEALEIKRISKKLKITQCRFFAAPAPIAPGFPGDTPKLFIGGFVRKDIQFTKVKHQTPTTVEGEIRDFVVDVPISGVVNLGAGYVLPGLDFNSEQEYEFARRSDLGAGFPQKEKLLSGDFSEFNLVSNSLLNRLPRCELIFSQINEMDEQLDRVALNGGPFEEGTFRTLQEKMVVVVQVAITFSPAPIAAEGCRCK